METHPKTNSWRDRMQAEGNAYRTIDLKPSNNELLKPAELIDISGASELTLAARRLYNQLLANAFGRDMAKEGHEWTIAVSDLRGSHNSNDRLGESIEALMKTIVTVRMQDGRTRRVQLLGGNDMGDPSRPHGTLTYSFDKRLVPLLAESTVFGKIEMSVMKAFTTKYALALYEALARRVRLKHVFHEVIPIADFRELLGVPEGKLTTFGNLNQYAIKPAMTEINAMAAFGVNMIPIKTGRKVTGVKLGWYMKNEDQLKDAFAELQRPKVGRKARVQGVVEEIVEEQGDFLIS